MITLSRGEQQTRHLVDGGSGDLAGRRRAGAGLAPASAPNPPKMTFQIDRFIAWHMM